MADLQRFLLFVCYEEEFQQSEWHGVICFRNNYDDAKFCKHFRSIVEVRHQETAGRDRLHNLPDNRYVMSANIMQGSFCDYKIRETGCV